MSPPNDWTTSTMSPLFLPLRAKFFEAFKSGEKTTEYRPYGQRWSIRTCAIGRRVTLSRGYGVAHRLHGTITGFRLEAHPESLSGWLECYGPSTGPAACITIALL
jgi:hypothetical protein